MTSHRMTTRFGVFLTSLALSASLGACSSSGDSASSAESSANPLDQAPTQSTGQSEVPMSEDPATASPHDSTPFPPTLSPTGEEPQVKLNEPLPTPYGSFTLTRIELVPAQHGQSGGPVEEPFWSGTMTWTNTTSAPLNDTCNAQDVELWILTREGRVLGSMPRNAIACPPLEAGASVNMDFSLSLEGEDRDPEIASAFIEDATAIAFTHFSPETNTLNYLGSVLLP